MLACIRQKLVTLEIANWVVYEGLLNKYMY